MIVYRYLVTPTHTKDSLVPRLFLVTEELSQVQGCSKVRRMCEI